MYAIHRPRLVRIDDALKLFLHFLNRADVEQLPKVSIAEQLAQLLLIDAQGLRAAFREGRIAVIDVVRHVAEEQRCGER